jgi:hypothetical protein
MSTRCALLLLFTLSPAGVVAMGLLPLPLAPVLAVLAYLSSQSRGVDAFAFLQQPQPQQQRRQYQRSLRSAARAGSRPSSSLSMNGRETDPSKRVVVTGMGVISGCGNTSEDFWDFIVRCASTIN